MSGRTSRNSNAKDEFQRLEESGQLIAYLETEFDTLERTLEDDRHFCEKEIESTRAHLKKLEEKFQQKTRQIRERLDQLQVSNAEVHQKNRQEYERETEMINELINSRMCREAYDQYQRCKENFARRQKVIDAVPTVPITESAIDEFFSGERKAKETPLTAPIEPAQSLIRDDDDKSVTTEKERSRRSKKFESTEINKDDDRDASLPQEAEPTELRTFASRSIHFPNPQQTTTTSVVKPGMSFSNRLKSLPRKSPQSSTATMSPSPPVVPRTVTPVVNNLSFAHLALDPVFDYAHDRNAFLLMAATARHIVIFKSQFGRVDSWKFGLLHRFSSQTDILGWNDGLILSMGYISNSLLYIFTDRAFIQYNPEVSRKADTRMLPRGNDNDEYETNDNPYENLQRGIGTVANGHVYHLFTNRTSNWVLSKTQLERMVHIFDYPVSQHIDDVYQWIHLNVNEQSINFLVQLDDHRFAVIFCSLKDVHQQKRIFIPAEQPLSICSAFLPEQQMHVYFVNDRAQRVIHILTRETYLESYPINAHAICYVAEKNQLLIAADKMILAMNLNALHSP